MHPGLESRQESERRIWQSQQLLRLVDDPRLVDRLLAAGVDWHDVEKLIAQGCSPELAAEILL